MDKELYIKFGDIGKVIKGKQPKILNYDGTNEMIYLNPEYLRNKGNGIIAKPDDRSVTAIDNDVLILWDGSNAGEIFKAKKGIVASTMVIIEHDEKLCSNFLYHNLKLREDYLKGQTSGSGIPHVDKEVLNKLSILNVNKNEQYKVALILDTIDSAIEKTETLINKQERIKKGLMQDLLTKGIDKDGNIRSEETHKFKDSPVGRIPVEWEIKQLIDVGSIISGGTPKTNKKQFWNDGNITWITPNDLSNLKGIIISDSERKITNLGLNNSSAKLIPKNSIVISSRAPIGYIGICNKEFTTNQGCKSIAFKENIDIYFLYYQLHTVIDQIKRMGSGTTFNEISKTQLEKINILIPKNLNEQKKISNILMSIDNQIKVELESLTKLKLTKKGLMQDLLTGKKRVTSLLENQEVENLC